MKHFLKQFKWGTLFPAFLIIAVGILLLVPTSDYRPIEIAAGVLLAVGGILSTASFIAGLMKNPALLLAGVSQLAIALWLFVAQNALMRVLTIALGVMLLLRAGASVYDGVTTRKTGKRGLWIFEIVVAATVAACAIVIFVHPFGTLRAILVFTGSVVLAEGVYEVFLIACHGFFRGEEEEETAVHRPVPPPRKRENDK